MKGKGEDMSANVETMFSVREVPWHGLGTIVEEAPTSKEAIELAGLNWKVESKPVFNEKNEEIPGFIANTRNTDGKVFGIVSNRYNIVQNEDAFSFTDSLIGEDVRYETAGSLREGRTVWLLAKMPERKILGDKFDPYICFTNSHDGFGAVKVCMTSTRVVCNNTLNLALSTASRMWSTRHVGNIQEKLAEAQHTLKLANDYMNGLSEEAENLAMIKLSNNEIERMFDTIYPIKEDDTQRKKNNVLNLKENFFRCYNMEDIAQFKGTAWGVVNAVSDLVCHYAPARMTEKYQENNWGKIMTGHPMMDSFYKAIKSVA